jgi:hypothetical protein
MDTVRITHNGQSRDATAATWQAVADAMVAELGPWIPGDSRIEHVKTPLLLTGPEPPRPEAPRPVSTWQHQVTDDVARDRIQATQDAVTAAGVAIDASAQLYATGTRMAAVGYQQQQRRATEHGQKQPVADAARQLLEQISAEQRHQTKLTAQDFADHLSVNGALRFDGYQLREQAVRGVLSRLGSKAGAYLFSLRDRIADPESTSAGKDLDRAAMLDVLERECRRFPDTELMLRLRDGMGDCFAVVSHEYGVADAPAVLPAVLRALPTDAKATVAYNPTTTRWELRASVFTPTPVDEQAVGEPFEGYMSFQSVDNGTGRLSGGGGILLIACLNASTYQADSPGVSRVHRGRILWNLGAMTRDASRAIHALCEAWGTARASVLELPTVGQQLVPIEAAIPGFYRHMLTARRGELVGVFRGRTEAHVPALAKAYFAERRDPSRITRADLANGVTRYMQDQPAEVRRDAESAVGSWLVRREPVQFLAA